MYIHYQSGYKCDDAREIISAPIIHHPSSHPHRFDQLETVPIALLQLLVSFYHYKAWYFRRWKPSLYTSLRLMFANHFNTIIGLDLIQLWLIQNSSSCESVTITINSCLLVSRLALSQPQMSTSKSHYYQQSVGQYGLVSGAHLWPATNFSFSLRFSFG
jgi:hypothetical protein